MFPARRKPQRARRIAKERSPRLSGSNVPNLPGGGLDPTADYAGYVCTDLVAGDWTWACDVPDNGLVTLPATADPAFYRIQTRK